MPPLNSLIEERDNNRQTTIPKVGGRVRVWHESSAAPRTRNQAARTVNEHSYLRPYVIDDL